MTLKIFSLLVTTFTFSSLFSQQKNYVKALKSYEQKNYLKANSLIDKCLKDKSTSKESKVFLLKSKIMMAIYLDKKLREKHQNSLKEATKYIEKCINQFETLQAKKTFFNQHSDHLNLIINWNNKEAFEAYNQDKFSKALNIFKRTLEIYEDTQTIVYIGNCYWKMDNKYESLDYYKKAADLIYKTVSDDSLKKILKYYKDPFRNLADYYIKKGMFDTALVIVKNGKNVVPNDPVLLECTYLLIKHELSKIPPSLDYLSSIEKAMIEFPTDSFFNHKENAIYIYLLNGVATSNNTSEFNLYLKKFISSKINKSKHAKSHSIKKYDIFIHHKSDIICNEFSSYLAEIGLDASSYYTFKYLIDSIQKKKLVAEDFQFFNGKNKSPICVQSLYNYHYKLFPKEVSKGINSMQMNEYTLAQNKINQSYYNLLPLVKLNELCFKYDFKNLTFKAKAIDYRTRLISESIDSLDFTLSKYIYNQTLSLYPENKKQLENIQRKMVENDFIVNYFGSRIQLKPLENNVPTFNWIGAADSCIEGKINKEIIVRLENRINYFRRMAGVKEIYLIDDYNENCQIAAMMCESNRSMSHTPSDGWRCFVYAGLDALKSSVLSKDANPSIAITASMGQNHITVGNRRWLLNPYAAYMGIGATKTYTSIWCIDFTNVADTNIYKNQFVAWPPQGYVPTMMVFKKWSFSIEQNIENAKVSMKNSKNETVSIKLEKPVDGYAISTLVWEPETPIQADEIYTVTVQLSNGKSYTYQVKPIQIKI